MRTVDVLPVANQLYLAVASKRGVIAAHRSARSEPRKVSSTVKDLTAGSGLAFEDAGEHELKGVPYRWRLYRVVGRQSQPNT